jgi:hypothetical protein
LDLEFLIESILNTTIGDANLDGVFDSGDFVTIFRAGEYEDGIDGNSTWAEGDWDCDAEFSTGDLVYAFQRGNYTAASIASRPHPTPFFTDRGRDEPTQREAMEDFADVASDRVRGAVELDVIVADLIFDEYQATLTKQTANTHREGHDDLDQLAL